jgi:hypothetical protein
MEDHPALPARRPVLPVYGYQKALDRLLRDLRVERV